jgi:hypothetical protein
MPPVPSDLSLPGWVVPVYLVALVPYLLLRAARWHLLLRPLGAIRLRETVLVGLAGSMWIALLPLRLGEFARPVFVAQRSTIGVRPALGTVALERVVDGLLVCGIFFASVVPPSDRADIDALYRATFGVVAAFAAALLVLLVMALRPELAGRVIRAVAGRIAPKLAETAAGVVSGIAQGLRALPSAGPLLGFVALSVGYWAANAGGMWILAQGCGLDLTLLQAAAVMSVMNIALIVPGGPAQFGVFQTGVALGLHMFVAPEMIHQQGSLFTFYLYVCQLGMLVTGGIWAQRRLRLNWRTALGL